MSAEGRRGDGKGLACKGDKEEVVYTVDRSYQLTSSDNKQQFRCSAPAVAGQMGCYACEQVFSLLC
jgi:hypothetical protein